MERSLESASGLVGVMALFSASCGVSCGQLFVFGNLRLEGYDSLGTSRPGKHVCLEKALRLRSSERVAALQDLKLIFSGCPASEGRHRMDTEMDSDQCPHNVDQQAVQSLRPESELRASAFRRGRRGAAA